jgi:hypothetical protein
MGKKDLMMPSTSCINHNEMIILSFNRLKIFPKNGWIMSFGGTRWMSTSECTLGFVMKTILTCNNELFMETICIKNYNLKTFWGKVGEKMVP